MGQRHSAATWPQRGRYPVHPLSRKPLARRPLGGALAVYVGFDDIQDKIREERQRQNEELEKAREEIESAKAQAERYKDELDRLKDEKKQS